MKSKHAYSTKMTARDIVLPFAILLLSLVCYPQDKSAIKREPVFRAPFVLTLHEDDRHDYMETFDKIPYVANDDVYLFAGDTFGIHVMLTGAEISGITYERDLSKADVEFKFTQQKSARGWMMLLVIRNKMKRRLYLDGLMTVPGKRGVLKTNVLPVEPNLSDFESWPHPIVQLVLRNFRFSKNGFRQ